MKLKVKLVRSRIGRDKNILATLESLCLSKIGDVRVFDSIDQAVAGKLKGLAHLLSFEICEV